MICDDYEDMEQESRLFPWLDDPGEEAEDMPAGYWADHIFDPPETEEE